MVHEGQAAIQSMPTGHLASGCWHTSRRTCFVYLTLHVFPAATQSLSIACTITQHCSLNTDAACAGATCISVLYTALYVQRLSVCSTPFYMFNACVIPVQSMHCMSLLCLSSKAVVLFSSSGMGMSFELGMHARALPQERNSVYIAACLSEPVPCCMPLMVACTSLLCGRASNSETQTSVCYAVHNQQGWDCIIWHVLAFLFIVAAA
jgi:hypothetical protein